MTGSGDRTLLRRFVPAALLTPLAASSLGVDGGAIFTIIALEDLGFDARTIGIAFGLGVVSIPIQLAAARRPLDAAATGIRQFLRVSAVLTATIAVFVLIGADHPSSYLALVVTVAAEIVVSVRYAPSWLPLQRVHLTTTDRQRLGGPIRAAGGTVLAVVVVIIAATGPAVRSAILATVASLLAAAAIRFQLPPVPLPDPPPPPRASAPPPADRGHPVDSTQGRPRVDSTERDTQRRRRRLRTVFGVYVLLGLGGWPLFLVFCADVLWPSANLGVVGAVQIGAGLIASFTWRSTEAPLASRMVVATTAMTVATVALAVVPAPIEGRAAWLVLGLLGAATAALTALRLALVETVHRSVDETDAVRVFTVLDVIGSSSMQLGLFVAGIVIASIDAPSSAWDPYRWMLTVVAVTTWFVIAAIARAERPSPRRTS